MNVERLILDPQTLIDGCKAGNAFQPLAVPLPADAVVKRVFVEPVTGLLYLDVWSASFGDVALDPMPVRALVAQPAAPVADIAQRVKEAPPPSGALAPGGA